MQPNLIETGRVINTHGLRGELKIETWSDTPEMFLQFYRLFFPQSPSSFIVENCRIHKKHAIVKLCGVNSIAEAEKYINQTVLIIRDDLVLDEGVYFVKDLLGLTVEDADTGEIYGTVSNIFPAGSKDVYEFKDKDGKAKYFPAISEVIIEVDITAQRIRIRPLEGLFDAL